MLFSFFLLKAIVISFQRLQFLKYLFRLEQIYAFIIMENSIIQNIDQKMGKTIDALKKDFVSIKAGRANPNILDNIFVDYYGSSMPINQLANITTPDSQLLVIVPWEKAAAKEIEKSIIKANIGITPQNDGTVIRLPIPPLTGERRLELVKQVKKIVEECKNSIRISRRDGNQQIKEQEKNKEIAEDVAKDLEKEMQTVTDRYIQEIDSLLKKKEKELTEF